ncbi:MAG TPA: FapA family protein, partial [Desulfobacteraceae bacterium]|nr:FapA family protein [Desulfobacteraceae bacterium]
MDEQLQKKADILENNLYNQVKKQQDTASLSFQIERERYQDSVVLKALAQLFPRMNVQAAVVLAALKTVMAKERPGDESLTVRHVLRDLSDADDERLTRLSLTLEISITTKHLNLTLKGVPPIPTRDGAIDESYIDHLSCPGKLMEHGRIDFREINEYPIIAAGDNLFYISREFHGTPGMAYNGEIIEVPEATPLELKLLGGVEVVEKETEGDKPPGYYLRAEKNGVVLLHRSRGEITGVGIRDVLEVKRLDYATGNIGTEHISPINIKIGTVCSGFTIRAKGWVKADVLEGGSILAESSAQVSTVEGNSRILVQDNIVASFVINSLLTAKTGSIRIEKELLDSTLVAPVISFEQTRGNMTNNILYGESLSLKKLYYCGENTIYFGHYLFKKKQELAAARDECKKEKRFLKEQENSLKEELQTRLKGMIRTIPKDSLSMKNVKELILAMQAMAFEKMENELGAIAKMVNNREVSRVKGVLEDLKKNAQRITALVDREHAVLAKIKSVEQKMEKMALSME